MRPAVQGRPDSGRQAANGFLLKKENYSEHCFVSGKPQIGVMAAGFLQDQQQFIEIIFVDLHQWIVDSAAFSDVHQDVKEPGESAQAIQ